MKTFTALIVREWREWRTVIAVMSVIYLLVMAGTAVAMQRGARVIIDDGNSSYQSGEFDDFNNFDEDDWDWFSNWHLADFLSGEMILFGYVHSIRGTAVMVNLALMLLALFYLADAVYKERSDGSTYFYRALPVPDHIILLSKLTAGTVGILLLSYVYGMLAVGFTRLAVPASFMQVLEDAELSLGQIAYGGFIWDWLVFHLLQLLWLSPYAAYMLLVSTAARGRPVMVGIGLPVLLTVVIGYFLQNDVLGDLLTSNIRSVGEVLAEEMRGYASPFIDPGEEVEVYGGFGRYLLSVRSMVSVIITVGLFYGTWWAYRRNLTTS